MVRTTLALVLAALALAARAEVEVPAPAAPAGTPPATARACLVEFNGLVEVASRCSRPCFAEKWDGPVLWISNECERTIWVSYLYQAADGRTYRTPCYELAAGTRAAVDEAAIGHWTRRLAMVSVTPGPGFPAWGVRATCTDMRTPVEAPPAWLDAR